MSMKKYCLFNTRKPYWMYNDSYAYYLCVSSMTNTGEILGVIGEPFVLCECLLSQNLLWVAI